MALNTRYDMSGNWYKGNIHLHTTISDGQRTPRESADAYANAGYDFLGIADHVGQGYDFAKTRASLDEAQTGEWPLVMIEAVELHGNDNSGNNFHILSIGDIGTPPSDQSFMARIEYLRARGCLLILAHPHLLMNTTDDVLRHGLDGVEVYNHLAEHIGNSNGEYWWDLLRQQNPDALGFAVDDAHDCGDGAKSEDPMKQTSSWGGGWLMVKCAEKTAASINAAIRTGNFYSSSGPEFHDIQVTDTHVTIKTSPIRRAWLRGTIWAGWVQEAEGLSTEMTFDLGLKEGQDYQQRRLIIEAENGRRAWSNTLILAPESK